MGSATLGLRHDLVDGDVYDRSVARFRDQRIAMPTFAQLADPFTIPASIRSRLASVDRDARDPLNLWRVHWHNDVATGGFSPIPAHVVLPPSLTGVEAPIVVLLGDRFPLVGAHKVLAAYACLAPRVVTGQFDPTRQRAIWPSTGNYARGGVAISRLMGCHGVAVLPENMSAERFAWLDEWVAEPVDVIRTPGSESNVKEIYDACAALGADPDNVVFNQFCEFANHLAHWSVTGTALERVYDHVARPGQRLAAFVSATGSAGTIAAGDRLKDRHASITVAVEALECPTLLANGFGEHRIQGIGDKHVPLIHNVMNTDVVTAVSDRVTDALDLVWQSDAGRAELSRHGVPDDVLEVLGSFGLSSICNVVAAIKCAKHFGWGAEDVVMTVATDGARLYDSERRKVQATVAPDGVDASTASGLLGEHLWAATDDHLRELDYAERSRVFNLGYFTWVEQQGIPVEEFDARRDQSWWRDLRPLLAEWDARIDEFNGRTGL
jgi:cysteine synthase